MTHKSKLIIYTDGGARGNPGPAGIGVVIYDQDQKIVKKIKKFIGEKTNNQAEYEAIVAGLSEAKELGAQEVEMRMDSELAVRQLNGLYKVKKPHIQALFIQINNLRISFKSLTFTHIPREKNKLADQLVNEAIDENVD